MKNLLLLIIAFLLGQNPSRAQKETDSVRYHQKPVTITATRSAQGWLQAPMAVNIIEAGETQHTKGYGLDEILTNVPGVLAQSRYGNQDIRITIRGFGARGAGARSNTGTSRGVRVLIDGFPETEPDGRTSFDLVDLSGAGSVEVVRSNASSVWGNASGGVVNVRSNTTFSNPFSRIQSQFGSFGFHKEMLNAGTMLGTGRFFLSASTTTSEGWRAHSTSSQTLVNTGILASLSEQTRLGVYLAATSNIFHIPGPLTPDQFASDPRQAQNLIDTNTNVNYAFVTRDERRYNRLGRLGVEIAHELDSRNSLSASAFASPKYLERSERNRFRDFNRYHVGGNAMYRNTILFSPDVTNSLMVGADEAYQDGAIHFYSLTPSGERGTNLVANKREGANTFGAFIQDEIKFSEQWRFSGGVRYDKISYFYDDFITPGLNDTKSFEHITPKAGISYLISPSQSIYANLGGGVEVPAGNEVDPSPTFGLDAVRALNPLLDPITSVTVEAGTKQLLTLGGEEQAGSLMYDVALYWLEVTNDIIPYADGTFYLTAGKTRRAGVELGGKLQLENGFSLDGNLTASDNKFVDYSVDSVHYGAPGKFNDLKDKKMSGVPDVFYYLGARYSIPSLAGFFFGLNVRGVGMYFADDANSFEVPAYTVFNSVIGFDHMMLSESNLSLSGFLGINNLTDRSYAASAWVNPQLIYSQPVYLEPGLPRNLVGSLSLRWEY